MHYLHDHLLGIAAYICGLALLSLGLWLDPKGLVTWQTLLYVDALALLFGLFWLSFAARRERQWLALFTARQKAGQNGLTWRLPKGQTHAQQTISAAYNAMLVNHHLSVNTLLGRQQDQKAFIDSWVHEIKLPLAAASLLTDSLDGKAPAQDLEEMSLQLDKIDHYVEQVLYYSRLDSFSKDYLLQDATLKTIAQTVVVDQRNGFITGGLRASIEGEDQTVVTDEKWLRFILAQLVSNAVKYTHAGGLVTLTCGKNAAGAFISVQDTGIGILPDELHRVFEKGFTGTNGRQANQKATGLGLYLAKRLCDKLGHKLSITSTLGQGTCATITFLNLDYFTQSGTTLHKPAV